MKLFGWFKKDTSVEDELRDHVAQLAAQNHEWESQCKRITSELSEYKVALTEAHLRLDKLRGDLSKQTASPVKTVNIYGLSKEVFNTKIIKALEPPIVVSTDSPQQVGYKLGIQRALTYLRENWVHD